MSKKEKINKLQAELNAIEIKEWWVARPHIAEFQCGSDSEFNDEAGYDDYFRAYGVILNHEWIKYNGVEWQTFCEHLDIPLYPDEEEIADDCEYYLRDIHNPANYDIDYPNFVQHAEETMRNPNYAN